MQKNSRTSNDTFFVLSQFLFGLLCIGLGLYIILSNHDTWNFLVYVFQAVLLVTMLMFAYRAIRKRSSSDALIAVGSLIFFIILMVNQNNLVSLTAILFGIWMIFNGVSHVVDIYVAFISGRSLPWMQIFYLMLEVTLGTILLINKDTGINIIKLEIGIYVIVLGLTNFISTLRIVFQNKTILRLPAPVFISALMPTYEVRRIHKIRNNNPNYITDTMIPTKGNQASIYIFSNDKGFDSMGHMAIGYEGIMYSYGNHDPYNRAKSLVFGDGVMIVGSEVEQAAFSIARGDTLFRFTCELTNKQVQHIEKQLDALFTTAVIYDYPYDKDLKHQHYLTQLLDFGFHGDFYKFNSGEFKTYSVFTTNCVLITDYIFQSTGMKFFQMSGIVSPGAYYDYLNGVLGKPGSIVIKKDVYQK